jgi:hypothetical protein
MARTNCDPQLNYEAFLGVSPKPCKSYFPIIRFATTSITAASEPFDASFAENKRIRHRIFLTRKNEPIRSRAIAQQLFDSRTSASLTENPPIPERLADSSEIETSLRPLCASSTSVISDAHRPQSQKWFVCRSGFSSNVSSTAETEMETTSN